MPDNLLDSIALRRLVVQTRAGDRAAEDQLIRAILARFENLARRMLNRFPDAREFEQTCDVVQDALLRLLRALKVVTPETTRDFFNLAAEQIRRQLLDIVRRYRRRPVTAMSATTSDSGVQLDPPDQFDADLELSRWEQLHAVIEELPAAQRETFMLTFYHGWTQIEIADLFQVDERTVRRRWQSACLMLNEKLNGNLPTFNSQS